MALQPGTKSEFDICLTDRRSKQEWYLTLDGGGRAAQRTPLSDDTGGIYLRAVGKRTGDFDEQRDWKNGRGSEYFNDDAAAYFDSLGAWALSRSHLTPSLQWHWATGYRNADMDMPGSVTWRMLIPGTGYHRYVARKFSASASYSADKCWMWLRKAGNPGDLTLEICSDNAGSPGTVLASANLAAASITDVVSECIPFDWSGTVALTSGTTYWIKVYCAAASDTSTNHWEIACNPTGTNTKQSTDNSSWSGSAFDMYFRVTDADTDRQWFFYGDETGFFAVDKKASGNSQHYTIGNTPILAENATTGLTTVTGKPVILSGYHFFPQGMSTVIRRWNGTQWRNEAAANKAVFLEEGYTQNNTPAVWKAISTVGTSGNVGVYRADAVKADGTALDWAADNASMLAFDPIVRIGTSKDPITGIYNWGGMGLYVFKSFSAWLVQNNKASEIDFGGKSTPFSTNGIAAMSAGQFLYFNWLFTVRRVYGSVIDDIGQGWDSAGLPNGREGPISCMCAYSSWLMAGIDAGADGKSSLWVWDGRGWHEIFRAPYAGMSIKGVAIQARTNLASRIWISCGGDVFYMTMPFSKARPIDDNAVEYMHEASLVSSTIDMGTASKLPKFISTMTLTSANLNGQGRRVELDYQLDDKIGTDQWISAGPFLQSPEDTIRIYEGGLTQYRYRLRLYTDNNLIPPDVKGIVPTGYARSPFRWVWNIRIAVGGNTKVKRDDLDRWLVEASKTPGRIYMTSRWPSLHDYYVIVGEPSTNPISLSSTGRDEKDSYTMTLVEV